MLAGDDDPQGLKGGRVGRRSARIAGGHGRSGIGGQDRRRAGTGTGRAHDMDALHDPDGSSGPCGLQPGPHPIRGGRHARSDELGRAPGPASEPAPPAATLAATRSSMSSRAVAALRRLFSLRSPLQT